jgi:hypothetical protein
VKDTSHASVCVSTEAEVGKKRKTQKLQDALSGIPVSLFLRLLDGFSIVLF